MGNMTISENGRPRYRAVRKLKEWLTKGNKFPDGLLPSEQVLSKLLGISKPTTHRALGLLADEGLIRCEGRQWLVVPSATSTAGERLLRQTVVFISSFAGSRPAGQISPGWEVFTQIASIQALEAKGCRILSIPGPTIDSKELRLILDCEPAGVIAHRYALAAETQRAFLDDIRASGIPLAVYGDAWELPDFDTIGFNHEGATKDLVLRLAAMGRKRILRVWHGGWPGEKTGPWFKGRDAGYEAGCAEAGLKPLPAVIHSGGIPPSDAEKMFDNNSSIITGQIAKELIGRNRADAVLCASDGMVPIVARACRRLGLEPGADVLIAGYDNYWSEIPERRWENMPPCLTVDKQNEKIGAGLVRLMLDRAGGKLPVSPQHRLVEPLIKSY